MPRKGEFKERIKVTCEVCGKNEEVLPGRAKKYKTCSIECMGIRSSRMQSQKIKLKCLICGKDFERKPSHVYYSKCCSKKCDAKRKEEMYSGEGNPNHGNTGEKCAAWRGGKRLSNYGYYLLHMPNHPMSRPDGYILEHRYIMSEHLGRLLTKNEHVHHKDENKLNNDVSNLQIMSLSDHLRLHQIKRFNKKAVNHD